MSWIRTVAPEEATGLLRQIYDAAVRRAGRVYNVVRLQSLRPKALDASMQLYLELRLQGFGIRAGANAPDQIEPWLAVIPEARSCAVHQRLRRQRQP